MNTNDTIEERDLVFAELYIRELPSDIDSILEQVKNSFPVYDITVRGLTAPMIRIRAIDYKVTVDAVNMLGEIFNSRA